MSRQFVIKLQYIMAMCSVYGGDWQSVHEAREGGADVVIVTCESAMTHLVSQCTLYA